MRSIIRNLYLGNINPSENLHSRKLDFINSEIVNMLKGLIEKLDDEGRDVLNEIMEAKNDAAEIIAEECFAMGFGIGLRLAAESYIKYETEE